MKKPNKPSRMGALAAACCLATAASTQAHEGHEHVTATLLWPDHSELDHELAEATLFSSAGLTTVAADDLGLKLDSWYLADGSTGYSTQDPATDSVVTDILADVEIVAYDSDYMYIMTSGIPSHDIGTSDDPAPAKAGDLNETYRISLNPTEQTGEKTSTGLNAIGIMVNGVSFYNQSDGFAWDPRTNEINGRLTDTSEWSVNALWSRADGLDEAGGHSSPEFGTFNDDGTLTGRYHYHQTPWGLLEQIDPDNDGDMGSVIVGYAFDGYAVVGPFAYEEQEDGSLEVVQMTSSYGLEDNRGAGDPSVEDYELGSFLEDFVYIEGSGNLNEYNMAFVKFDSEGRAILADEDDPDGDWAYFLTWDVIEAVSGNDTDLDGSVAYPYIVGPEYYGVVDEDMLSPDAVIQIGEDVTYFYAYTVPEPVSAGLLAGGLVLIARRRRR